MPNEQSFSLPWPPTMNTYWRSIVSKNSVRVLISKRGRTYRQQIYGFVLEQRKNRHPMRGRLSVAIYASPPDKKIRDLDNLLKPVLDSLTHAGVWVDDCQIDKLSIERVEKVSGGQLLVIIEEIQT